MGAFTEQQVRERLLTNFVDQDPVEIALVRPVFTTSSAGGRIQAGTIELEPQTFYFYPFKRRLTKEVRYNPQSFGEEKVEYADYILIFLPGVDIEQNDYFQNVGGRLEDGRYTVEFVSPRQWDRQQAGILFRG
jgi:hypothetical protein